MKNKWLIIAIASIVTFNSFEFAHTEGVTVYAQEQQTNEGNVSSDIETESRGNSENETTAKNSLNKRIFPIVIIFTVLYFLP